MVEKLGADKTKRTPESFWRWFRNVSALGALALAGAGMVLSQYNSLFFTGSAVNAAQAGGGVAMLRRRQRKQRKSVKRS